MDPSVASSCNYVLRPSCCCLATSSPRTSSRDRASGAVCYCWPRTPRIRKRDGPVASKKAERSASDQPRRRKKRRPNTIDKLSYGTSLPKINPGALLHNPGVAHGRMRERLLTIRLLISDNQNKNDTRWSLLRPYCADIDNRCPLRRPYDITHTLTAHTGYTLNIVHLAYAIVA
jgi:hypothetical protein